MKQYNNAIENYSNLLAQLPNDPILLSSLGSLYYQMNVIIFNFSQAMRETICIILKKVIDTSQPILII
jgi:hypothetical protein